MAGAVRPAPAEVPIPRRRSDDRLPVFFHEHGTAGWPRLETTSNFSAMYRARVRYEAAVEAIGKDVVAKSQKIEDAAIRQAQHNPNSAPLQGPDTTAGPDLRRVRTLCACPSLLRLTPAKNS
jgi:hypothetical protein